MLEADFERFYQRDLSKAMWSPGESLTPRRLNSLTQGIIRFSSSATVAELQRAQEEGPTTDDTFTSDELMVARPELFVMDGGKDV